MQTYVLKPDILIIDDDPNNLAIMSAFLEESEYTVLAAEDGETGINRAKFAAPDLILLDIMMPNINGYDTCRRLKQSKETKDIPVIFVTALAAADQKVKGLAVGAVDFISKPFQREEVLARVEVHINLAAATKRLQVSKGYLETIIASIQDAMFIVGKDGTTILSQNTAAETIYGPAITPFLHCQRAITECLASGAPVKVNRNKYQLDDRHLMLSITVSPLLTDTGVCYGAVVLTRDETLLESLEQAVTIKTGGSQIIGNHPKVQEVHNLITDCSKVDSTVLILGESGTGKELVANLIQEKSDRRGQAFVKVNCSGISEMLIESELFGHVKGAFTGAHADRVGRFELADGGTLFLDEIGDVSPRLQLRLLRVLENRSFERVGDSATRSIDVRIMAATNCNLEQKMEKGEFRKDLYYRLNVFTIKIPPLRERRNDIPILVSHFINLLRPLLNKEVTGVSDDILDFFTAYNWDGNVRELRNALEYAMVRTHESVIPLNCLPTYMFKIGLRQNNPAEVIRLALIGTGGNKAAAARALGIDRKTIYNKIREYGIVT
jgi:two-component system response regulator HydG